MGASTSPPHLSVLREDKPGDKKLGKKKKIKKKERIEEEAEEEGGEAWQEVKGGMVMVKKRSFQIYCFHKRIVSIFMLCVLFQSARKSPRCLPKARRSTFLWW